MRQNLFYVFSLSLPRKERTDFNELLVESVKETISEVLGARVTPAFWYHYQAHLGVTQEEMPYRLDTLFSALKGMFGVGGETLGRRIVKKLYAKAEVALDYTPDRPLTEYVEELKEFLAQDLMQKDEDNNEHK
jgi:hypothetical protein